MINETKRDVFEYVLARYHEEEIYHTGGLASRMDDYPKLRSRYASALPDDLPVIPEAVGEYLKWCKKYDVVLSDALDVVDFAGGVPPDEIMFWMSEEVEQSLRAYIWHNEDTFARALVLGVWRVEETGEIVKLEAEK